MTVYSEDKKTILEDYDLEKGYIKQDKMIVHHDAIPAVERKTHEKILRRYPNGSLDVETVVDIEGHPAIDAYDEEVDVMVYVPYSYEELQQIVYEKEVVECHEYLDSTDWCVIKCLEYGTTMDALYPEVKAKREQARARINQLESVTA